MKSRRKAAKLSVQRIIEPEAGYISLVDRGANKTPFTVVKREGHGTMAIKKRGSKKSLKVKKQQPPAQTATHTAIAKMVFDAEQFETEAEVLAKVEEMEWEVTALVVTKNDNGDFVVAEEGRDDDFFETISEVETDEDGVSAFVGRYSQTVEASDAPAADADEDADEDADGEPEAIGKSDDDEDGEGADDDAEADADADEDAEDGDDDAAADDDADDAPEQPAKVSKRKQFLKKSQKQRVKKFSFWDAYYSDDTTLAGVIKEGMSYDDTPPGFEELSISFTTAIKNILSSEDIDDKKARLDALAAEYAAMLYALDQFFEAFLDADEATLAKSVENVDRLTKWAEGYAAQSSDEEVEAPANDEPVKVAKSAKADKTQSVEDLLKKALGPITEQVSALGETVADMSTRQTSRKAVSVEDGNSAETQTKSDKDDASSWVKERQAKSLLG